MIKKEFASEIANAFARGYNIGVETERKVRDEKEKYSVDGVDILIIFYQLLSSITTSSQKDTEFGKGMRCAFNAAINTIYYRLSHPKILLNEDYMKLAEKLRRSSCIWNEDEDTRGVKK